MSSVPLLECPSALSNQLVCPQKESMTLKTKITIFNNLLDEKKNQVLLVSISSMAMTYLTGLGACFSGIGAVGLGLNFLSHRFAEAFYSGSFVIATYTGPPGLLIIGLIFATVVLGITASIFGYAVYHRRRKLEAYNAIKNFVNSERINNEISSSSLASIIVANSQKLIHQDIHLISQHILLHQQCKVAEEQMMKRYAQKLSKIDKSNVKENIKNARHILLKDDLAINQLKFKKIFEKQKMQLEFFFNKKV